MKNQKDQDKAAPTLITGLGIGLVVTLSGFPFVAAGIVVVALFVSYSMFAPVRDAETEAETVAYIYRTIKAMGRPSPDRATWLQSLSYDDMIEIRDVCRFNNQSHIYRYLYFEWKEQKTFVTTDNKADRESYEADISDRVVTLKPSYKSAEQRLKEGKQAEWAKEVEDNTGFDLTNE